MLRATIYSALACSVIAGIAAYFTVSLFDVSFIIVFVYASTVIASVIATYATMKRTVGCTSRDTYVFTYLDALVEIVFAFIPLVNLLPIVNELYYRLDREIELPDPPSPRSK